MAIVQSILTQLSNKIDLLVKNTERINEIPPINSSNCLVCESKDLKVIATKRKKKGFTYRICVCAECGSTNKQIIETISVQENEEIFTAKNSKVNKMLQSFTLSVINEKIVMDMTEKSNDSMLNKIYDKVIPSLKEYTLNMFQKDYDRGMFKEAKNSIDPVEIRFTHNHDPKRNLTYLFLKYLKVDTKNIKNLKVITSYRVTHKQISPDREDFFMDIKNITFITEKK